MDETFSDINKDSTLMTKTTTFKVTNFVLKASIKKTVNEKCKDWRSNVTT